MHHRSGGRPGPKGGRGGPPPEKLREEVQRVVANHTDYDPYARTDTGNALREATLHVGRDGESPALHVRYQPEGIIDKLSPAEREALGRAGFYPKKDHGGTYLLWRQRRARHLWITLQGFTWMYSESPRLAKAKWLPLGRIPDTILPIYPGTALLPMNLVRESLTTIVHHLLYDGLLPYFMYDHPDFRWGIHELASRVAGMFSADQSGWGDLLSQLDYLPEDEEVIEATRTKKEGTSVA